MSSPRLTCAVKSAPIFQDFLQFNLTVDENIRLGDIDAPVDREDVVQAARLTGAAGFIDRLPNSYETLLGRMFDGGQELSVGQWQRLALARALFRKGQIIVLDEPTSSQDARSEYEFFENFRQLASGPHSRDHKPPVLHGSHG